MVSTTTRNSMRDVDTGWAWVALLGTVLGNFSLANAIYSLGIFHIDLLTEFQQSNAATALVGSVFTAIFNLIGPFGGILINATSCRVAMMSGGLLLSLGFSISFLTQNLTQTIITIGVVAGIGYGFAAVPLMVMAGFSFQKYRGVTNGIVMTAAGCGMFASGPFSQLLLNTYGLHGAYLMMGGFALHLLVFGSLMQPSGFEIENKRIRYSMQSSSSICAKFCSIIDISTLKNKSFLMILLSTTLWYCAFAVTVIMLPSFAVATGFDRFQSSLLMLIIGAGSCIGRLLSGMMTGGNVGLDPVLLQIGHLGILGLLTFFFPLYSTSYWQQSVYSFFFGIYTGGLMSFRVPICVEIVGVSKLPSSLGLMNFACGIGSIIGPTIAGVLVDVFGSYAYCFYYSGGCFTASLLLLLFSNLWRPKDLPDGRAKELNTSVQNSNIIYGSGMVLGSVDIAIKLEEDSSNKPATSTKEGAASFPLLNGHSATEQSEDTLA